MNYQSEVIADTPVAYYRLDMTGAAVDGDSIPDLIAGLHAELIYQPLFSEGPSPNAYGYASPIETDASSWEFRSWANAAFTGFLGTSRIRRTATSEFQPTGDTAVEAWLRPEEGMNAAVDIPLVGTSDIGVQFYHDGSQRLAAYCVDSAGTRWIAADTSFDFTDFLGVSFHVVAVRVSNALAFYVNGELKATTAISSALPTRTSGGDFFIGRNTALLFHRERLDEVAFYDHSLTGTRILAHYEAALNAILLHGVANAQTTAILRSVEDPDPVEFPFRHNWTETLIERLSFRSAISQSVNGVEEGTSERLTPRRELEFTQLLRTNAERRRFRALLWANQHAKWFIPVRQDMARLLTPLSTGATTAAITTQFRDYEVGGWIGFRQLDGNTGEVQHAEVRAISSLSPLTFEALTNDYASHRSFVYPVRRALLASTVSGTGHTDAVEEWAITARLLPEDESLTPNRVTAFTPTIKYRDVEVFNGALWQANDWSEQREYEVDRRTMETDFDTSLIETESDTVAATETFTYRMTLSGHESISSFLGWYYERVGALTPVWVPTMQEDFEILGVNAPNVQITVRDTNYSDAYALAEPRRDIVFVYRDGSMAFRRVTAFEGTVNETLTLDAAIPSLVNLRFVSLLKYVRLDADQLELAWQTDEVIQVAWRFRELLTTPEGTGRSSLSPSASLSASVSPSSSASPSASVSPSLSPSLSPSPSASISPSGSVSPSASISPSGSQSPSASPSPTPSASESPSPSASTSPSSSESPSPSPSASASPSV